jgi:zinc transport system ATP-binding protein
VSAAALRLEGVSLRRNGRTVLEDVNLSLEPGETLALLGPNGSGKTTLLRVILGLVPPDTGRVRIFDEPPARARGHVGYVPQHARFDPDFPIRVLDVVLMGRLHARGLLRRFGPEDRRIAREALALVEMTDCADRAIGALSGGQLQRVLIARALAVKPRLLLLDEPMSSLDERIGVSLWDLLGELAREMTVVLVSHDIGAVSQHVRSVACLNRRLFMHPSRALTADLIESAYGPSVSAIAHDHGAHAAPSAKRKTR